MRIVNGSSDLSVWVVNRLDVWIDIDWGQIGWIGESVMN